MKIIFFLLISLTAGIAVGQQKHKLTNEQIDRMVDKIYSLNTVTIKSIKALFNSDFEQYYKVVFYNGTQKKIVGIELGDDFSNTNTGIKSYGCFLSKRVKITIASKQSKTCFLHDLDRSCPTQPRVEITDVVFSDGTIKSYDPLAGAGDEITEKEIIKKKLLKQLNNK